MSIRLGLLVATVVILPVGVNAQPAEEPPSLRLPQGARVRLQAATAPSSWVEGFLVSADTTSVALVPTDAPPVGGVVVGYGFQMPSPVESVSRTSNAAAPLRRAFASNVRTFAGTVLPPYPSLVFSSCASGAKRFAYIARSSA